MGLVSSNLANHPHHHNRQQRPVDLSEPALGIGKLGSRLGPPIGGGLAHES